MIIAYETFHLFTSYYTAASGIGNHHKLVRTNNFSKHRGFLLFSVL